MKNSFSKACTETLEILKYLPENEYKKIPKEEIEFLESQKDSTYKFYVDKSLQLQEMNISKETNAIIVMLWEKYFASQNEKERLYKILKQNYEITETRKKEMYNYDNIFKERKKESTELIEVKKETWYEKIRKFFSKIINNF